MTLTLTKDDIAALRQASDVSFNIWVNEPEGKKYAMRASRRVADPVWAESDTQTREIFVEGGRIETYRDPRPGRTVAAHASVRYGDPRWKTIASLLKEGDEIHFHFEVGNDTETVKEVGLTIDQFSLIVRRKSGQRHKELRFGHLETLVAPESGTWRMARKD